jgi:hypothetical protein
VCHLAVLPGRGPLVTGYRGCRSERRGNMAAEMECDPLTLSSWCNPVHSPSWKGCGGELAPWRSSGRYATARTPAVAWPCPL